MTRAFALAFVLLATPALAKPPRLTLFIAVDALGTDLLLRSRVDLWSPHERPPAERIRSRAIEYNGQRIPLTSGRRGRLSA